MRNFLWVGSDDREGSHLVRWDFITRPKEAGGLGIDSVKFSNETLISKWIWRQHKEPNQLWRRPIDSKYVVISPGAIPSKCKHINSKSPWFNIVKMETNIGNHIQRKVRNGANTLFWFHQWTNETPLYQKLSRFFHLAINPLITVRDAWNTTNSTWDPHFRRSLLPRESQNQTLLSANWQTPINYAGVDITYWALESSGCFSVKSIKNLLNGGLLSSNPLNLGFLWKTLLPKKCKFFTWSLIHKGINTIAQISKQAPLSQSQSKLVCPLHITE